MQSTPDLSDPTYRIEAPLGSGGGGVVYKAWHTRLQKHVVIKELKYGSANDLETQRNEVEALKNVKSAYLPQVYDFLTEGERIFTVIEFIEGESLDRLLERGEKFTQAQVVKWYGQLASALEAIHKKNVCHRDIKPANIMLLPEGSVCLIDFNAALVGGNDVRLISRSLGYASPEQYEIYERFKSSGTGPMHLGSSSVSVEPFSGTQTEILGDMEETEILRDNSELTEILNEDDQRTEILPTQIAGDIDWKRSDIYSLGATMYHLLTGEHPPADATEVVPVSKLGHFGEAIAYIIEQSMSISPLERFASVAVLAHAVRNIHIHDTRWKVSQSKKIAAAIILPLLFVLSAATAIFGAKVMAQEKEGRYYEAVSEIEKGGDIELAYGAALGMFWDRIDPYRAMAKRLWDDGDIDACRQYIEQNLGNIAQFQSDPDAAKDFGDIYYILGNCHYYLSEPDYNKACGNFEIAVEFVKDNPAYYRDYAISLARTGKVKKAGDALERTYELNLDAISLKLLHGEMSFTRGDYDEALQYFKEVIATSDDDYIRYRAYHTSDETYRLLGKPEESVKLLEDAMSKIPFNRLPEMTERLADAYVKSEDYDKAIELFERLSTTGAPQFHIMQNLAILLQNQGKLDSAATVLKDMGEEFPEDYRIPMRQAFLEAERQSKIKNENRDYDSTKRYYDAAVHLYGGNIEPGSNDPEMGQLEALIEQLRHHNWIR